MTQITDCPVCQGTTFTEFLTCKDYTVSHETFRLQKCGECSFVLTSPRPQDAELPGYYQSADYISHSDKARGIVDHLYRIARSFTVHWKYRLIRKHTLYEPQSVLDYGCGTGAFLSHCRGRNIKITGVEPADNARAIAAHNTGAKIYQHLTETTGQFDVITLWHVLEHVTDLNTTLGQLKLLLRENGTMFIAVPNHNSADAKKYKEHWAAYDVPRHLWHFSRNTMTKLLSHWDLQVQEVLPMPLDSYYVSILSEKYRTPGHGILNLFKGLLAAIKSNRIARQTKEYSSLIYVVRQ